MDLVIEKTKSFPCVIVKKIFQVTDLFYKRLILHANMEICYLVKSFAGGTCGFSYREYQVVPLRDC